MIIRVIANVLLLTMSLSCKKNEEQAQIEVQYTFNVSYYNTLDYKKKKNSLKVSEQVYKAINTSEEVITSGTMSPEIEYIITLKSDDGQKRTVYVNSDGSFFGIKKGEEEVVINRWIRNKLLPTVISKKD